MKSPCASFAPVANWASKPSPFSAKPTAAPPIWPWPTRPICIGPPKAAESYLKIDRVISAAEIGNVQAIHPGYGFLAENAHFAEICRSCEIEFIGPTHEAMALVGDKNAARKLAKQVDVPTVPGSEGLIESEAQAVSLAHQFGFPVLIKASAGGGGRGMRVALNDLALKAAIQQAQAEAQAAFGNGDIYLEKYVEHPRHVEVQVIADNHGNVVHLWERDCTMQRRHQKLIEESPGPKLDPATRTAMCDAAVRLVRAANYTNAGTIEFIVAPSGDFYFIEMNARIQVEHPVTEMITGIDLIKAQILVASGERLPFGQADVRQEGAAIECRINAEDPDKNFRPTPGHHHEAAHPRRIRRAVRFPRPRRLRRFALLRLDDRKTDRPPADPPRSHRVHEACPRRVAHRRHQNHHPPAPANPRPRRLQRGKRRYNIHRANVGNLRGEG